MIGHQDQPGNTETGRATYEDYPSGKMESQD